MKPFMVKGFKGSCLTKNTVAFRLAITIMPIKNDDMKIVTDKKSFTEKILNDQGIQLVRFYADWSGPCQMMAPIYKELSTNYSAVAGFFTVDVEAFPMLKAELGVIELPTILFYKNGRLIDFVNGMLSKIELIKKIEHAINSTNEQ